MLILDFSEDEDEDVLLPMPPVQDHEEVKLEPQETIAKRIKLNSPKIKIQEQY